MSNPTAESNVLRKTRELSQTILDDPEVQALRRKIDAFASNEDLRRHYETLVDKGDVLHQKQHAGEQLSQAEVDEFDKLRESFLKSPVASAFLDAQEDLHHLQQQISMHVKKTFELGRMPDAEDLESGCGHGCGCHH